jgi:hypothetical protein
MFFPSGPTWRSNVEPYARHARTGRILDERLDDVVVGHDRLVADQPPVPRSVPASVGTTIWQTHLGLIAAQAA